MKPRQKDILGDIPEIGDIIVYNPPYYKGLVYGKCVGFTTAGLPELEVDNSTHSCYIGQANSNNLYTPKTGFVIKNKK